MPIWTLEPLDWEDPNWEASAYRGQVTLLQIAPPSRGDLADYQQMRREVESIAGHINGNFAGGIFIQHCNRWSFRNVTSRNYNGDGFSFQVCDDIRFQNCKAINNRDLGFHPGSGSQRPVFKKCLSRSKNRD